MNYLELVKNALGIPTSNTKVDITLNNLISASLELLRGAGVSEKYLINADPLVASFVIIYTSTNFGYKADGSLKELPKHFDLLLRQLSLTKND